MKSKVLVLLSGGIDSSALVAHYLTNGDRVEALHIAHGQPAAAEELNSSRKISSYYQIPLHVASLGLPAVYRGDEILFRNAIFVLAACMFADSDVSKVALGIHCGVPYYDCSSVFIRDIQRLVDGYLGGTLVVEAPFLNWTKRDVYKYCKTLGVPVDLTYSCNRSNRPCGQCPSCIDRSHYHEDQ